MLELCYPQAADTDVSRERLMTTRAQQELLQSLSLLRNIQNYKHGQRTISH